MKIISQNLSYRDIHRRLRPHATTVHVLLNSSTSYLNVWTIKKSFYKKLEMTNKE